MQNIAAMKQALLFCLAVSFALLTPLSDISAQTRYIKKVDKYLGQNDTAKALTTLNKYIDKKPEAAQLYLKRAMIKIDQKHYDPALVDLNSFCSVNKTCGEAEYWKGVIMYKQGNYTGAVENFGNYSRKFDKAESWFYLALSHMWLQNYNLSMYAFTRSLEVDANQPAAWYNAGVSAYRYGDHTKADSLLRRAQELSPEDLDVKMAIGLNLAKQKDFIESNKVLRSIQDVYSNKGSVLFNIGLNYFHMDEREHACEYWSLAAEEGHGQGLTSRKKFCDKKPKKGRKK